ncbi:MULTISPECIES: 2-carboxy-1,4-naphthoquinone phytyltransferase [Prochlorococcus]|uniref:2-carboxy-1,4-naphthoquinone phytyltransferase n=1 Tax=Prochlorococcus marinus (strain SARG / CCMP1375 / SS120) TaxID=167539 RepID=Q7VE13_PROMA|nr:MULTISPECIES: 2-carboxy-1,4-naphthoquinone phytyltransferase [Prochlorococcus]AAP99247.1 1,4-dihydroxy-2-naphthoate octaprenyltransferase [Prochlorococcus marinus subsp. marinus str. CCMP1375]KGG11484.1 1,4-dihydroxy-2-naphthoate octaprenyltransferase [Prochlorococcus marinus str. LG]KGG18562.1 1,4-dihydroxy-2-naphthoate octaprenyltransferase [Prochlorococcus marinus str. SS2]KGG22835.1 1,4-dihydroxy-2-naphthoate octaprenyltransferase [Prochlorococcus marinus str. SS35]KGG32711.1 1,4-dihydr
MKDKNAVASLHSSSIPRKKLWKKAIKWPLYSVAIMPVILAAGWKQGAGEIIRLDQLVGFLIASILLLIWENLTNDLFDSTTGVDEFKLHSIVVLTGRRRLIRNLAYFILFLGLILILILASRSHQAVFFLVIGSCALGYLYQGPPFRLGYQGLGEPLCWLAFGPLATAASLLVLSTNVNHTNPIPWKAAISLGAGPAVATTLVLFCANFHQVSEDAAHGKKTLLVRLGTGRAAAIVPWFILLCLGLEWIPIVYGQWPVTALLGGIGIPPAIKLIRLLTDHHNHPKLISESKFLALRFQALNGIGLSIGLALAPFLGIELQH